MKLLNLKVKLKNMIKTFKILIIQCVQKVIEGFKLK